MTEGQNRHNPYELPPDLPVPEDDGACDHLPGLGMPHAILRSTLKRDVDVAELSETRSVFFFYPATGKPGVPSPRGWDSIPGARGCTPESCSYRDHFAFFKKVGFQVFGVSAQKTEHQLEFAMRNQIPYEILSDADLRLATTLHLPTFKIDPPHPVFPPVCIKRLTLIVSGGIVRKVFYPVFPPDKNAEIVLRYIRDNLQKGAP